MGTIAQKLTYLEDTKTAIGNAIAAKGGSVTGKTFRQYATEISNLPSGGGDDSMEHYLNNTLTSYTVPASVTILKDYAFASSSNLLSINLNNVTTIGSYSFYKSGLTTVNIPDTVTEIGTALFYDCSHLTTATLGTNITNIKSSMFYNCISLKTLYINGNITDSGSSAFTSCSIDDVYFANFNSYLNANISSSGVILNNTVRAYDNGVLIENLTWPSTKTTMTYALQGYLGLKSLIIPDEVTSFGSLSGCRNLRHLTVGSGITSIGYGALNNCRLDDITINGIITSTSTWEGFNVLYSATINNPTPSSSISGKLPCMCNIYVPSEAVEDYKAHSSWSSKANRIFAIGSDYDFTKTQIRRTSQTGTAAFDEISDTTLTTSNITDKSTINLVIVGDDVTEIGESAFATAANYMYGLIFGHNSTLTTIGRRAFYNGATITKFTRIKLPPTVTTIGNEAFYMSNNSLFEIEFTSLTPPTVGTSWINIRPQTKIKVPASAVETYKTAWPSYADYIYAA